MTFHSPMARFHAAFMRAQSELAAALRSEQDARRVIDEYGQLIGFTPPVEDASLAKIGLSADEIIASFN
jgi:hypothetical protein